MSSPRGLWGTYFKAMLKSTSFCNSKTFLEGVCRFCDTVCALRKQTIYAANRVLRSAASTPYGPVKKKSMQSVAHQDRLKQNLHGKKLPRWFVCTYLVFAGAPHLQPATSVLFRTSNCKSKMAIPLSSKKQYECPYYETYFKVIIGFTEKKFAVSIQLLATLNMEFNL